MAPPFLCRATAVAVVVTCWAQQAGAFAPTSTSTSTSSRRLIQRLSSPSRHGRSMALAMATTELPAETEVVIVGSGLAGLCCGALLAHNGVGVTVLESHSELGGACHTWERLGYHFESGPSLYSGFSSERSPNPLKGIFGGSSPLPSPQLSPLLTLQPSRLPTLQPLALPTLKPGSFQRSPHLTASPPHHVATSPSRRDPHHRRITNALDANLVAAAPPTRHPHHPHHPHHLTSTRHHRREPRVAHVRPVGHRAPRGQVRSQDWAR